MYTPNDIKDKAFSASFMGYHKSEVDEFIASVYNEFDRIYRDNIALKDKLNTLSDAIKEYKTMESALQNAIYAAQTVADEIKKNAHDAADNITNQAKNKSDELIAEASGKVQKIEEKYAEIKASYTSYKAQINALLQAELALLKDTQE